MLMLMLMLMLLLMLMLMVSFRETRSKIQEEQLRAARMVNKLSGVGVRHHQPLPTLSLLCHQHDGQYESVLITLLWVGVEKLSRTTRSRPGKPNRLKHTARYFEGDQTTFDISNTLTVSVNNVIFLTVPACNCRHHCLLVSGWRRSWCSKTRS